jgi:acetoin utilization protein AcuC
MVPPRLTSPKTNRHHPLAVNAPFTYHPRMLSYDFGPKHPLKPERLRRTIALIQALLPDLPLLDPGEGSEEDPLLVHSPQYVETLRASTHSPVPGLRAHGLGTTDTPWFAGIYEASLAYTAGSARAAREVRDGCPLAFGISGGLHHAQRDHASGFCVFNDPAIACAILRERFERVAYVDIDLHHGDGVQDIFADDPTVLTLSIHQFSPGFYPGTGRHDETGTAFTSINIPMPPKTQGEPWLLAFQKIAGLAFERFRPEAVVLQMGTDPHTLDPLGHLDVTAQAWLGAVRWVRERGLPIVALGGGGYCLTTVPRMWTAAVLTLLGRDVPELIPSSIPAAWGMDRFLDSPQTGESAGMSHALRLIDWFEGTLRDER